MVSRLRWFIVTYIKFPFIPLISYLCDFPLAIAAHLRAVSFVVVVVVVVAIRWKITAETRYFQTFIYSFEHGDIICCDRYCVWTSKETTYIRYVLCMADYIILRRVYNRHIVDRTLIYLYNIKDENKHGPYKKANWTRTHRHIEVIRLDKTKHEKRERETDRQWEREGEREREGGREKGRERLSERKREGERKKARLFCRNTITQYYNCSRISYII